MRVPLVVAATSVLALVACGSGGADDTTDQLPDADALIDDAAELGISPLALAFDRTASADAFRFSMSIGISIDDGVSEAFEFDADPSAPLFVNEVDAEGQSYMKIDFGPLMTSMGFEDLFADGLADGVGAETWVDGSTLYYDRFGSIPESDGASVPEGIFTVDLLAVADVAGETHDVADFVSFLTGQAVPDPVEMANVLKETLADADADGSTYAGTITFVDYVAAMGGPIDDVSSDMTGGVDQFDDVETLMGIYEAIEVDVSVTVASGAVDVVTFDIDTQQRVMDYDIDASIDVVIPEGDFPDATSDFISAMSSSDSAG